MTWGLRSAVVPQVGRSYRSEGRVVYHVVQPKPGVLGNSEAALDRLFARGTVMGVCSISLRGQARRLATNAGVSAEEALKEWTANLIPGVTVIPSGTWGVNRAQESGCTYCAGG